MAQKEKISKRILIDAAALKQAEFVFDALGISTGMAINIFINKVACTKGIPFDMNLAPIKPIQEEHTSAKILPISEVIQK